MAIWSPDLPLTTTLMNPDSRKIRYAKRLVEPFYLRWARSSMNPAIMTFRWSAGINATARITRRCNPHGKHCIFPSFSEDSCSRTSISMPEYSQ